MAFQNAPMQRNIFDERYGLAHTRNPDSKYFAVHPSDIGFLVGKNGSTLKKIARDSGVSSLVLVPYTRSYPSTPPHFEIKGHHTATINAIAKISEMCRENLRRQWEKSAKQSDVRNSLTIEREDMKMVIGKNGRTIQGINKKYNVRTFTRPDEKEPSLKSVLDINGFGPDVGAATNHIMNIVNESQHRRGVQTRPEEDSEQMFQILKEQEDKNMFDRMMRLHYTSTQKATDEFFRLHLMLQQSDPALLKRIEDACKSKEPMKEKKTVSFSDEENRK